MGCGFESREITGTYPSRAEGGARTDLRGPHAGWFPKMAAAWYDPKAAGSVHMGSPLLTLTRGRGFKSRPGHCEIGTG